MNDRLSKYKRSMKLVLLAGMVSILLLGCSAKEEVAPTGESNIPEKTVPVEVVSAKLGQVSNYVAVTGETAAIKTAQVTPQAQGEVEAVYVEVGDRVKKGAKLLQLDQDAALIQLKQAEASVKAAQANLTKLLKGAKEEEIASLEAQLKQAKSAYEQAKSAYTRQQKLFEESIISKQTLEQAESQYIASESGYKSAQLSLKLAKEGATAEEIKALEAQVAQAKAGLESAKLVLSKTTVVAPIEGIVSRVDVSEGEVASMQSVIGITNIDRIKVMTYVSQSVVNKLRITQEVKVELEAIKQSFTGQIKSISPVADQQKKSFPVEIIIENPNNTLKSGMYTEVILDTDTVSGAVVISEDDILNDQAGDYIYVAEDGKAVRRDVEVGLTNGKEAVILRGVEVGDKIIVSGQDQVKQGTNVEVVNRGDK
ncbi:RND family efflux transporter MFP subunit [Orenia metallireducens]|uniref:RND family efflux transporter, MFP subunit n=1 Tax=Orenia metallireducens TaxID=1413210 RepID=A0A285IFF5_9FIRM|nr:efflux RND transporter periplasmic adaptor subunit [Orenia metallireducens]PRX18512.1 RND family efflux transporter MFP subunit [Orenia metallireducens]SNY46517.1 RND family efflux transporter, MFP subunit [Orenia metallireducens]